ncbi:hypothetical protein [Actinoplanes sp. TFC3]|uniref:hypothetical protein n=1 Tax=Actinoplanes sp. TFC3 TaxID=1710355 RepID=UPI000834F9D9|nr:hypothetical protein [Actinoplanes sp. TFC3]
MTIQLSAAHTWALDGVTNGDWLAVAAGIVIGIVGMTVAVAIARWQRRHEIDKEGSDQAERSREGARQAEYQLELQNQQARRDARQHQYIETSELLRLGQQIEWRIRHDGPFTATGLDALRLGEFARETEQLSARVPDRLRLPLQRLAATANRLQQTAMREGAGRPALLSSGSEPDLTVTASHADFRLAVEQERVAQEMHREVAGAWAELTDEWGS